MHLRHPPLREVPRCRPRLRLVAHDRAHGCLDTTVPVAVSAVDPVVAGLVGLGVHDGVDDLLGEQPEQRLDVHHPVSRLRYRVCQYPHSGPRPFPHPVLCGDSRLQDRDRFLVFTTRRRHAYTNISDAIDKSSMPKISCWN